MRQAQKFQNSIHAPDAFRPAQPRTAYHGGLRDVFGNAHGRIQNIFPGNEGDVGPDKIRGAVQKLVVVTDAAPGGRQLAGQHGEQRAFPGSAGPQDAHHFPAFHGQVNVVQHAPGAQEFLGHSFHAEGSDRMVFFIQHPGGKTAAQRVVGIQVHHVPIPQGNPSPNRPAIEQQRHGGLHHFQPAGIGGAGKRNLQHRSGGQTGSQQHVSLARLFRQVGHPQFAVSGIQAETAPDVRHGILHLSHGERPFPVQREGGVIGHAHAFTGVQPSPVNREFHFRPQHLHLARQPHVHAHLAGAGTHPADLQGAAVQGNIAYFLLA